MDHRRFPKVELHRHLEGSLRLPTLIELADQHGCVLPAHTPETLRPFAQVDRPMGSLEEVLAAFGLFQDAFRSLAAVERITEEAVEDAAIDGIRLLELRFSPGFMAQPAGLDWDEMMGAVLRGVEKARSNHTIAVGLIAIASRSLGPESAKETVAFALNWREHLVGFDLADAEEAWPARDFAPVLRPLHAVDFPITVHSGENTGPEHIQQSVDLLHAQRIGHGVSVVQDDAILQRCIDEGWVLEMCPTSNLRTRAVSSLPEHPAARLLEMGAKVTLNSDDPGLFDITLSDEYALAEQQMGFDEGLLLQAHKNAVQGSFVKRVPQEVLAPFV